MIKEDKNRLFKLLDLFSTIKDSGDCLLSNYRKIMKSNWQFLVVYVILIDSLNVVFNKGLPNMHSARL